MTIIEPLTKYQIAINLFKSTGLNPYHSDFVEDANPQQGKIIDAALNILKQECLHETQQQVYKIEGKTSIDAIEDYIEILKFELERIKKYSFEYICHNISIEKCHKLIEQIKNE